MNQVTKEELRKLLSYDLLTGEFTWNVSPSIGTKKGSRAGHRISEGYNKIRIRNRKYIASRLAFMYVLGRWPHKVVDHINGDSTDDRWINLRDATLAQNRHNSKVQRDNKLGVKCVSEHRGQFRVAVDSAEGRYEECFPTLEQATDMAIRMRQILHGDFAK